MAISNVQIANRALQKLGAKRISSLDQDHPNARSMNAAFERVRDAELRRYDWGFAIRRASVASDASQTLWGSLNRFSLPNDYIRLIRDDESGGQLDWKLEAGSDSEGVYIITADSSPLEFRYVAQITDPNKFDALFVEAFATKLALECCKEISDSTADKESLKDDYEFAISEARRFGAIEKPAQEAPEDEWLSVRR